MTKSRAMDNNVVDSGPVVTGPADAGQTDAGQTDVGQTGEGQTDGRQTHKPIGIDPLTVQQGEHGVLRVFALDMGALELDFLSEKGALADILGVRDLDETKVQVMRVSDLDDLGVVGFLRAGCDVGDREVCAHITALSRIDDGFLVVPSSAFAGAFTGDHVGQGADGHTIGQTFPHKGSVQLTPKSRVHHVVNLNEPSAADWQSSGPIETKSADLYSAPRQSPRAARIEATRVGAAVFTVFMIAIAAVLWWIIT
jgi:hypothetical protein